MVFTHDASHVVIVPALGSLYLTPGTSQKPAQTDLMSFTLWKSLRQGRIRQNEATAL